MEWGGYDLLAYWKESKENGTGGQFEGHVCTVLSQHPGHASK